MADNFVTNPAAGGATFAADDNAGVLYPYVKLVFGADNTFTIVSVANPLPTVQTGALPAGTNNIGDVDVLTMPAITGSVSITGAVDTELPAAAALADNAANPTAPAVGAFGMLWDSATWDRWPGDSANGGKVNVTVLPALPTGTNTIGSVKVTDGTDTLLVAADGTIGVTVTGAIDTELPTAAALADAVANPTTTSVGVFLSGFNGTTWDRLRSTTSKGLEVDVTDLPTAAALADGAGNPTTSMVGANLLLYNGTSWDRVRGDTTNGIDVDVTRLAGNVSVVQATASSLNAEVQGDVAHDAAAAGNPLLCGLRANTSEPATAVADGDVTYAWGDKWGRSVVTLDHPPKLAGAGTDGPYSENSTASGDVELIAAPGASTSIVVTGFWISNQGAAKNRVALREGAAGAIRYRGTLAADGGGIDARPIHWVLPANTALTINIGTAGDIDANIDFFVTATP